MNEHPLHDLVNNKSVVLDKLDRTIADLEGQIGALQAKVATYRSLRDNICSLIELVKSEKPDESPSRGSDSEDSKPKSVQFQAMCEFFKACDNEWADTTEISEGTHLRSHAVRQMLYARYPSFFEQRDHPDDQRRKQFRMNSAS